MVSPILHRWIEARQAVVRCIEGLGDRAEQLASIGIRHPEVSADLASKEVVYVVVAEERRCSSEPFD
jgi:hypothetical protein